MEHPALVLFMQMETKAQRREGTCSKPQSIELAELELQPGFLSLPQMLCPLSLPVAGLSMGRGMNKEG